jgi:hypothetical protein
MRDLFLVNGNGIKWAYTKNPDEGGYPVSPIYAKNEHDYLFGGCAFEKYPTKHNESKQDDKAFLFQLHPNKIKLKI